MGQEEVLTVFAKRFRLQTSSHTIAPDKLPDLLWQKHQYTTPDCTVTGCNEETQSRKLEGYKERSLQPYAERAL